MARLKNSKSHQQLQCQNSKNHPSVVTYVHYVLHKTALVLSQPLSRATTVGLEDLTDSSKNRVSTMSMQLSVVSTRRTLP